MPGRSDSSSASTPCMEDGWPAPLAFCHCSKYPPLKMPLAGMEHFLQDFSVFQSWARREVALRLSFKIHVRNYNCFQKCTGNRDAATVLPLAIHLNNTGNGCVFFHRCWDCFFTQTGSGVRCFRWIPLPLPASRGRSLGLQSQNPDPVLLRGLSVCSASLALRNPVSLGAET